MVKHQSQDHIEVVVNNEPENNRKTLNGFKKCLKTKIEYFKIYIMIKVQM